MTDKINELLMYKEAKIKMLIYDFMLKITDEEKQKIMKCRTTSSVDTFCRDLLKANWEKDDVSTLLYNKENTITKPLYIERSSL